MKAVILVGGEGTRLRPLTYSTPKAMMPVLNRPFLEHLLVYLKNYEVDDVVLTLCYLPHGIRGYFGDGSELGVKLTYVMEDPPLGTAGAVKNAQRYLGGTFFVLNGDIFADLNLSAMLQFHREKGSLATIALTAVDDPSPYGVVETDEQGRVLRFVEKPRREDAPGNMINAGVYILESDVLEHIPQDTFFMFEHDLFPLLLERGEPIYGYPSSGYWIDMGTPEKYFQLHRDLLAGKSARIDCHDVGVGVSIHPTAHVEGTVVMDEGCAIGRSARIKGPVTFGRGCQVGEDAVIEDSGLWQGVHLGRRVTLRSCIVGSNCSIGDDVMLTSSIIGDGAVIASSTKMEPNAKIPPGSQVEKSSE